MRTHFGLSRRSSITSIIFINNFFGNRRAMFAVYAGMIYKAIGIIGATAFTIFYLHADSRAVVEDDICPRHLFTA